MSSEKGRVTVKMAFFLRGAALPPSLKGRNT